MTNNLLTISIATKDRPFDLNATLRKICEFGLSDTPLIIFDDASSPKVAPENIKLFRSSRIIRVEQSVGQACGRNQICNAVQTPFLLQLDDDSYPIEGDMETLLKIAMGTKDLLAIALPFDEPRNNRPWPVGIPKDHAIKLRNFVGCSVLLNVHNFRKLGGYAPWIGRTVEEDELSIRGWKHGIATLGIDVVRVRHEMTPVARSQSGIAFRSFRNWLLTWLIYAPAPVVPIRIVRLLIGAFYYVIKMRDLAPARGFLDGWHSRDLAKNLRSPLTMGHYMRLKRMPSAFDFYNSH